MGVLLVGAEQLPCWLCCTGLNNLARRCPGPGNTPRSTSKLPTIRLCPSAATELGRAAEAQVSAQSSASFPAAVRGTAATRSGSFQAQCQGFLLLLVKLGYHLNPHSSCMNHWCLEWPGRDRACYSDRDNIPSQPADKRPGWEKTSHESNQRSLLKTKAPPSPN